MIEEGLSRVIVRLESACTDLEQRLAATAEALDEVTRERDELRAQLEPAAPAESEEVV